MTIFYLLLFTTICGNEQPADSSRYIYKTENQLAIFYYNKNSASRTDIRKYVRITEKVGHYISRKHVVFSLKFVIFIQSCDSSTQYLPFIKATEKDNWLPWDIHISYNRCFCLSELLKLIDYCIENFETLLEKQVLQPGNTFGTKHKVVMALKPEDVQYILDSYKGNRNLKRYQK
jgi:hypothetical protein